MASTARSPSSRTCRSTRIGLGLTQKDWVHATTPATADSSITRATATTVQLEHLKIGDDFNPEVGFVRRDDMVREYARFKFSPRPRSRSAIRKYVYDAAIEYIENGAGRLESRERAASSRSNSRAPIASASTTPTRSSSCRCLRQSSASSCRSASTSSIRSSRLQHRPAARGLGERDRGIRHLLQRPQDDLSAMRGRMPITNQLSVEPTYTFNHVTLEQGKFTHPSGRVTCHLLR